MDNSVARVVMVWPGFSAEVEVEEVTTVAAMMYFWKLKKQCPIIMNEVMISTEASETNLGTFADAIQLLYGADLSTSRYKAVEFLRIIENLSSEDLSELTSIMRRDCIEKYGGGAEYYLEAITERVGIGERVKNSGGGGGGSSLMMNSVAQGIGGVLFNVLAEKITDALGYSFPSIPWVKPIRDASAGVGITLLVGAALRVLGEKKPGLSKIMVKFGLMSFAIGTLLPMMCALTLPPVAAVFFGTLMAFILVASAALA